MLTMLIFVRFRLVILDSASVLFGIDAISPLAAYFRVVMNRLISDAPNRRL